MWFSLNSAACFKLVKEPFQIHRPDQRLGAGNQRMGAVTPQLAGEGTLGFSSVFCRMPNVHLLFVNYINYAFQIIV